MAEEKKKRSYGYIVAAIVIIIVAVGIAYAVNLLVTPGTQLGLPGELGDEIGETGIAEVSENTSQLFSTTNISSEPVDLKFAPFDITQVSIYDQGNDLVFLQQVKEAPASAIPNVTAPASIYSYSWLTSLPPSAVGFNYPGADNGKLALLVTSHPTFDDTPQYDENMNGQNNDDGDVWHTHWAVVQADSRCGPEYYAFAIHHLPNVTEEEMPSDWSQLPFALSNPGYVPFLDQTSIGVRVPITDVNSTAGFSYDAINMELTLDQERVPPICAQSIFDAAGAELNGAGEVTPKE